MLVSARVLPNSTLIRLKCSRPRTRLARGAQEGAKSRLQYLSRKLIQKKVPLLAQFGKKRQCPACVSDDSKQVLMHCLRVSYRNVEQEIRKLFRRRLPPEKELRPRSAASPTLRSERPLNGAKCFSPDGKIPCGHPRSDPSSSTALRSDQEQMAASLRRCPLASRRPRVWGLATRRGCPQRPCVLFSICACHPQRPRLQV